LVNIIGLLAVPRANSKRRVPSAGLYLRYVLIDALNAR